jgi:lysophospholipase L1-like esterase
MSGRGRKIAASVALAALFLCVASLPASTTTKKKPDSSAPASNSKARTTAAHSSSAGHKTASRSATHSPAQPSTHGSSSASHTVARSASANRARTAPRRRVHYASLRVDPARRAALIAEISDRLKDPPAHAILESSALDAFYAQLASYESSLRAGEKPTNTLRVLQWGDSHTAADVFTGEARRQFQQQYGDGGIGYSYAGYPFAGFRIFGSKHSQSSGWKTQGNKFLDLGDGELGMGGISISTQRPDEWVSLDAPCTSLELQYLQQPGGGSLLFTDNGGDPIPIQTDAPTTGPGTFRYTCPPGDHHFEVETTDYAPVALLGWVATQPGVTWEMIGINGAEAPLILKWDQKLFAQYLKDNSPALIVLAYGTNEAASPLWDEDSYRQTFANLIDTIHSYVPESSILVVGPADRSLRQHYSWQPFSGTDRIIDAQREVCRTHDCAYWDERERMGGFGSMQDWVYAGWAQPDHTHFTGDGYRALAGAFMADLMSGFQEYKQRHGSLTESAVQGAGSGNGSANP